MKYTNITSAASTDISSLVIHAKDANDRALSTVTLGAINVDDILIAIANLYSENFEKSYKIATLNLPLLQVILHKKNFQLNALTFASFKQANPKAKTSRNLSNYLGPEERQLPYKPLGRHLSKHCFMKYHRDITTQLNGTVVESL